MGRVENVHTTKGELWDDSLGGAGLGEPCDREKGRTNGSTEHQALACSKHCSEAVEEK